VLDDIVANIEAETSIPRHRIGEIVEAASAGVYPLRGTLAYEAWLLWRFCRRIGLIDVA